MIKRPLVWVLAAYVAGIYLSWQKFPLTFTIIVIFILLIVIYLFMYRVDNIRVSRLDKFLWSLPFFLLLGSGTMQEQLQQPELSKVFEQELTCELTGRITMIVEKQSSRTIYLHNNKIILTGERPYLCENVIVYTKDDQKYLIGNQLTIKGTLQKFTVATNPGQFNEQLYYQIENIDYKMNAEDIVITDSGYSKYQAILGRIKAKLIKVYATILSDKESGTLIAMLLGEKYLLTDEIKQLYQANGISHILAISGLHVSLIGMFIFAILKLLKFPITMATFLSIFFIYSYGVLTNFSVSTNRAVVMMVVSLLSILPGKTYDMLSAMALSAFIILLQNPLQIFSAGFLLSFGAVFGIAVLFPCLKRLFPYKNTILDGLFISFCAQLTTTPFVIYFFYQFPVYSIVTNLIILPFVSVLTLTSIFAGIAGVIYLPLGVFMIGGANYILRLYEWICRLGSSVPGNLITVGKPDLLRLLLYAALITIFIWSVKHYENKFLILIPLVALLLLIIPKGNVGLEVTFLDVGQGDSIYMKSRSGTTYLVDGGSTDIKKVGKYRLQPFLLSQGTDCLDYVIMTHSDSDHINGLMELMENGQIKIKQLLLPYINNKDDAYIELEKLAVEKGIMIQYIKTGDIIKDGTIRIICLHPSDNYTAPTANSYSTVLSINYGEFDMLLTGDLQEDGETMVMKLIQKEEIWRKYGLCSPKEYEVLKVAHHGSKYSSTKEFLELTSPGFSIISCGKVNIYGHPHEETLERLNDINSTLEITYEVGAITIKTDGSKMELLEYLKP